jgi:ATP synthase protein I
MNMNKPCVSPWQNWKWVFCSVWGASNMNRKESAKLEEEKVTLASEIKAKAARKLKARRNSTQGVWFGLGMMGLIGWSVVIPTLLGALIGLWLDKRSQGNYVWTLTLLVAGLSIGCFNAWHWVAKEDKEMREKPEDKNG